MSLVELFEILRGNPSLIDGVEQGNALELGRGRLLMPREAGMPRILSGSWATRSKVIFRSAEGRVASDQARDVTRTKGGLKNIRVTRRANPQPIATVRLSRVAPHGSRTIDR